MTVQELMTSIVKLLIHISNRVNELDFSFNICISSIKRGKSHCLIKFDVPLPEK